MVKLRPGQCYNKTLAIANACIYSFCISILSKENICLFISELFLISSSPYTCKHLASTKLMWEKPKKKKKNRHQPLFAIDAIWHIMKCNDLFYFWKIMQIMFKVKSNVHKWNRSVNIICDSFRI